MKVMRAIKYILQLHIIGFMLGAPASSWAQTAVSNDPEQTVNRLHETLLKAMREGEKLGFQGRVALLAPVINQTHDLDFIARTTPIREINQQALPRNLFSILHQFLHLRPDEVTDNT
ncbi:MAG: hypothetical protein ABI167_07010 [Nitrosospira sp.]